MASAPLFDFMLLRGDILAMCIIIIIIVSLDYPTLRAACRRGAAAPFVNVRGIQNRSHNRSAILYIRLGVE